MGGLKGIKRKSTVSFFFKETNRLRQKQTVMEVHFFVGWFSPLPTQRFMTPAHSFAPPKLVSNDLCSIKKN